jgi:hypothetical protein
MSDPPVAIPALAVPADHIHSCFMAANTVCLEDLFPVIGNPDFLRRQPGEKEPYVLHSIDRLPDIMDSNILVRQMTINALLSSVSACMGPRLKL